MMAQANRSDVHSFIYPHRRYQGQFKPEALVFNANLQEFSQRVSYICNLQTRGKLSTDESYKQISELWEQLSRSYSTLGIEKDADVE